MEQMTGSKDFSAIGEFIEEHSLPFYVRKLNQFTTKFSETF